MILPYYNTKSIDQIIPVIVSTATGYSSKYVNAGTVVNKGVELSIYATWIQTQDFSWTTNINWTRNRNKVVALYDSSKNLQIASFQGGVSINATLDQPYGTILGKTWQKVNGEKLVGSNGRYVITSTTDNVIGNITYSFPESMVSKLKVFKGVDLSIIGRNLWIIHKKLPYADPEENLTSGNAQGYQSGAYPTTRTIGANLKLKF